MIDINKKYRTRSGCEVRIYATDGGGDYPIHGAVKYKGDNYWSPRKWKDSGKENWADAGDLIEVSPYEDFKIDDKVLAWCAHGKKYKRYFAGLNDEGKPMTFPDGVTSWSTEDWDKEVWDYCEKVCDQKQTDVNFLQWMYDRLENVHGENPKVDYMIKLKSIIEKTCDE